MTPLAEDVQTNQNTLNLGGTHKVQTASQVVKCPKSKHGAPQTTVKDINQRFKEFYETLYSSKTRAGKHDKESLL